MKKLLWLLLLCTVVVGSGWGQEPYQVADAVQDADGIQRLSVRADSYLFEPNYIVVKAGYPVELSIVRDTLLVPHDFVLEIPESGVRIEQSISTSGTLVSFTPTAPGKFIFYCSKKLLFFESHRDKGMKGVLEVKP